MIIKDSELDKTFIYFLMAYYFHWTTKQVDETDAYLLESLVTILPLWKAKTQEIGDK
jgi:hypothetical protein